MNRKLNLFSGRIQSRKLNLNSNTSRSIAEYGDEKINNNKMLPISTGSTTIKKDKYFS